MRRGGEGGASIRACSYPPQARSSTSIKGSIILVITDTSGGGKNPVLYVDLGLEKGVYMDLYKIHSASLVQNTLDFKRIFAMDDIFLICGVF